MNGIGRCLDVPAVRSPNTLACPAMSCTISASGNRPTIILHEHFRASVWTI